MNNKIVTTLAKAFQSVNILSIRYNYRGVGKSGGTYGGGEGETEDLMAIIDWCLKQWPKTQIILSGFSFGGGIALKAALHFKPLALITIAPAIHRLKISVVSPNCPWLLVQSLDDQIVSYPSMKEWIALLDQKPTLITLDKVGHFFHGHLIELRTIVEQYLNDFIINRTL
ncbi:MAG: hypothetical protein JWM09_1273 [Francisellaceae bacterium]|nr:hypothetical protein [Francisellaceae bacterium]